MQNLRLFKISFLNETDTKPARIKIMDQRFLKTRIINFDDENNMLHQASEFLKSVNIDCDFFSYDEATKDFILLSSNFVNQIK